MHHSREYASLLWLCAGPLHDSDMHFIIIIKKQNRIDGIDYTQVRNHKPGRRVAAVWWTANAFAKFCTHKKKTFRNFINLFALIRSAVLKRSKEKLFLSNFSCVSMRVCSVSGKSVSSLLLGRTSTISIERHMHHSATDDVEDEEEEEEENKIYKIEGKKVENFQRFRYVPLFAKLFVVKVIAIDTSHTAINQRNCDGV